MDSLKIKRPEVPLVELNAGSEHLQRLNGPTRLKINNENGLRSAEMDIKLHCVREKLRFEQRRECSTLITA